MRRFTKRMRRRLPLWYSYEAAVTWLLEHRIPGEGIAISSDQPVPYPEVTGYLIPTLLECGERQLAIELAQWLISIQRPDGGFAGPDGEDESYLFDTGQVLRGLVAVAGLVPEIEGPIQKAADWMISGGAEPELVRPRPGCRWVERYGDHITENIHLYCLPPLAAAGDLLGGSDYHRAVAKSLDYYTHKTDLLEFKSITHFYGYVLEALVDLGRADLARTGLSSILETQQRGGAIPALRGATWICSPGALQLAIVGYKLGLLEFANAAMDYMQDLQLPNGGFFGSYGPGAAYAENGELSWACKYFLDACHWRMRASFRQQRERFRAEPDEYDIRRWPVLMGVGDASGLRVLDVGCGRGQFLRLLQDCYPTAELWGVDVAEDGLNSLPLGVHRKVGSMLNLPFDDGAFDVVLCIEALEHAVRIERAVSELCRVLKPGGRLVILDKSIKHLGSLPIEVWEQWFDPDELVSILDRNGVRATCESLGAASQDPSAHVLQIWRGTRSEPDLAPAKLPHSIAPARPVDASRLIGRYNTSRTRAQARQLAQEGFAQYADGKLADARHALLRAVALSPDWLLNRGVLSIVVESLIGSGPMRYTRHLTRSVRKFTRAHLDGAGA